MVREKFQLTGAAAEIYEAQKVPAIFGPLAEATLERVALTADDTVLDIACGTGIVARNARAKAGPGPRIVGCDLNEGMIATARRLSGERNDAIDWQVADAAAMPFANDSFSLVICQQGFQYFPDEDATLREIRRLLKPGGRLAITVWSRASVMFSALAEALARHAGPEIAERSLAPYAWKGAETFLGRLAAAGFAAATSEELAIDRRLIAPEADLPREIMSNPIGPAVAERGDAVMAKIVAETLSALAEYRRGDALVTPQHSHLFRATAA